MAKNFLGEIRRTQVLEYGPGSIIDFRSGARGGGPVSVIAAGLEHWDITAKPPFPGNDQVISEPRLERMLGVKGFRLPPVDDRDSNNDPKKSWLVGARFPYWLHCPSCNVIKAANKWDKEPGDPSRWCPKCSSDSKRVHAIPTRFVTACENGHIDEFPWVWWLSRAEHKRDCQERRKIKLENRGSIGLSGLFLVCMEETCGASISMEGIFSKNVLEGLGCRGRKPWFGNATEDCGATPRILQRGASNLYFPIPASALSIPPWSDKLQETIGVRWSDIIEAPPEGRKYLLMPFEKVLGKSIDELLTEIDKRIEYIKNPASEDLKQDEYRNLIEGNVDDEITEPKDKQFEVRQQTVSTSLSNYVEKLVKVVRLREVRALKAFTRIHEPASMSDPGNANFCALSAKPMDWLPAVEVRGEGVFISLNKHQLSKWENNKNVCARAASIDTYFKEDWSQGKGGETDAPYTISPRFLLIHTLAHALMRYMSLECGYDTASLRERLFIENKSPEMYGILIYTSSSDAEGTLGGLARQAEPDLFENILFGAIESISWCSSDPLCINGITSVSETFNIAACHSCVLVPETSCELFNRFLDRAMLIGSHHDGTPGFFENLINH